MTKLAMGVAALACACGIVDAVAARSIDFTTQAGLDATCPPLLAASPKSLRRDDERVAFAICSGVSLATDAATWWRVHGQEVMHDRQSLTRARIQLESYLERISTVREALERVQAPKPVLVVAPGEWAIDFDGDGRVSIQERHFFRVPKRGLAMSPLERARGEADYLARYVAPVVNVDRSDVLWARAYCNFAEAALHLVLSYDLGEGAGPVLVDAERVRTLAYPRLRAGLRDSVRLRKSLLAEKHDDREWIPNPRQHHTAFPLMMDDQTFATWGSVLAELQALVDGKALLGGHVDAGGLGGFTDLAFGLCPPGSGIDVQSLFTNPLAHALNRKELASRCIQPSSRKPMTRLAALITASIARNTAVADSDSGEWALLRHLYWVN